MASFRMFLAYLLITGTAEAYAADQPVRSSRLMDDLKSCRGIGDAAQRLACYDSAAAKLEEATAKRDVIIVDREDVRKTKRSLFGLDLPNFSLFGGKADEDKERISQIDAVAKSVREGQYGVWRITLDDGATWETNQPAVRTPRPGSKIRIKAGALSSYLLSIDGAPSVKAHRIN